MSLLATSIDVERMYLQQWPPTSVACLQSAGITVNPCMICLGSWSKQGQVKDSDEFAVTILDEVRGDEENELKAGWDDIG